VQNFCLPIWYPILKNKKDINILLPVVLCGWETRSLTLSDECRLRVFEDWVLRRIFGPKEDKGNRGMVLTT